MSLSHLASTASQFQPGCKHTQTHNKHARRQGSVQRRRTGCVNRRTALRQAEGWMDSAPQSNRTNKRGAGFSLNEKSDFISFFFSLFFKGPPNQHPVPNPLNPPNPLSHKLLFEAFFFALPSYLFLPFLPSQPFALQTTNQPPSSHNPQHSQTHITRRLFQPTPHLNRPPHTRQLNKRSSFLSFTFQQHHQTNRNQTPFSRLHSFVDIDKTPFLFNPFECHFASCLFPLYFNQ